MAPASGGGLCDVRAVEDPWEGAQHADGGSSGGGADGDSLRGVDDEDEDGDTTSQYDGGGSDTDVGGADDDAGGADNDAGGADDDAGGAGDDAGGADDVDLLDGDDTAGDNDTIPG